MTAALNLRQSRQMTIALADDLDVPAFYDRASQVMWVRADQSDEDITTLVGDVMRELLRPTLTAVSAGLQAAPTSSPRPQLRLVRE